MRSKIILGIFLGCSPSIFSQEESIKTADSLSAVGEKTEAIKILQNLEPKSEKVYLRLAQFQKSLDQNENALNNYQKVLKLNPGLVLSAQEYGELLLETGNLDKADSVFTELSKKYPDNAGFVYRTGLAKEKKKGSTAMNYFFNTVRLDSTHQGALYKTAKFELQRGKPHNAIHLCETGLKTRPQNVSLLSILGQAYLSTLQFREATIPFEKLLELGENSEFILEKLASAYRRSGQLNKAIETYNKMLAINNMNGAVHTNLGALHLKKDQTEKAQEHFMMALFIANQPADSECVNLGLVYKEKENFRSAYISFEKALEENPDNERAHIEIAIVADAHYKDKQAILNHYQNYLNKFKKTGRKDMISIAEFRVKQLKKEIHMAD